MQQCTPEVFMYFYRRNKHKHVQVLKYIHDLYAFEHIQMQIFKHLCKFCAEYKCLYHVI